MLASLQIENMAVIRCLNADFDRGFTAITGETGAGKSVMMESLYLLSGGKAERDIIRHGEEKATVTALFCDLSSETSASLGELGIETDEEGYLSLTRTISRDGKSVCRLNGKTVSLSVLRDVLPLLLHIHSQEDNTLLRKEGSELTVLDAAAHNLAEKNAYLEKYHALCAVKNEIDQLRMDESEKIRTIETLRYQLGEIDEVAPKAGEEDALFEEKMRLRNIEKISKQAGFAYRALRGAEKGNACYIMDRAAASLRTLSEVLPEAEEVASELEGHLAEIEALAERITLFADLGGVDPTVALDNVESRLAALAKLTRKYGGSLEKVIAFADDARERLATIEGADDRIFELEQEYANLHKEGVALASVLHETRVTAAKRLEKEIAENLRALDMPSAEFRVDLLESREDDGIRLTSDGFDRAVFMAAVNVGEPFVPIAKSASGGEMSRIMLAIKTVIARHDGLPTVVFDEVDSGVSGKTSRKIGFSLLKSAETAQILSITHSAQIASLAHRHLLVYKEEKEGRTESSVRLLSEEERVEELSRILGGIAVTESQRAAARDMLRRETL